MVSQDDMMAGSFRLRSVPSLSCFLSCRGFVESFDAEAREREREAGGR